MQVTTTSHSGDTVGGLVGLAERPIPFFNDICGNLRDLPLCPVLLAIAWRAGNSNFQYVMNEI